MNTCVDAEGWGEEYIEIKEFSYHHCSSSCLLSDHVPGIFIKTQQSLWYQPCTYHRYCYYFYLHFTDEENQKRVLLMTTFTHPHTQRYGIVLNNACIFKRNQTALIVPESKREPVC